MIRRHLVLGAPVFGVAFALGCTRRSLGGDRTSAGTDAGGGSAVDARTDAAPRPTTADAGRRDEATAPPEEPHVPPARHVKRERWPRPAKATGTERQLEGVRLMPGIKVFDHGQERVPPDRWQIQLEIADPRAAAALRKRGVQLELGDYPTEEELREDLGPAPGPAKRRH
jgi:hypothetical protein